jgi:hypothetical protein
MFISDSKPMVNIDWLEWRWVILASAIIILLSSLPYIAGFLNQKGNGVFVGTVYDRPDYAVHLSAMRAGWSGEWQYRMRFTSETHPGVYTKLAYIFLGHLSRYFRLNLTGMYHIARIMFGFASCLLIYAASAWSFQEVFWRRFAFCLATLASGLGWLQLIFGWVPSLNISPIDFWLSDAYYFFGLVAFPHFSAITALTLGILLCGLAYSYHLHWQYIAIMTASVLVLQSFQPYAPIFADLAIIGIFLAKWKREGRIQLAFVAGLALFALLQIPILAYDAWVFASDPVWEGFIAQNATLSPPSIYLLWGFGILLPLAFIGLIGILRRSFDRHTEEASKFTPLWAFVLLGLGEGILAYMPTMLQRRFLHAMTIPLAILAAEGLRDVLFPWINAALGGRINRWRGTIALLLISFASISSLLLSFGGVLQVTTFPDNYYTPSSVIHAIDWLGSNAPAESVVLAAPETSFTLVERTDLTAYLGHPIETLQYEQKVQIARDFYCDKLPAEPLKEANVRLVVSGPYESRLTGCNSSFPQLDLIYSRDNVDIFRIP